MPSKKKQSNQQRQQKKGKGQPIKKIEAGVAQILAMEKRLLGSNKISKQAVAAIHPTVDKAFNMMLTPCNRTAPLVGLPTYPSNPTRVARAFIDFSVTTGTAGVGFVGVNPALANDTVALTWSTSAYAGLTLPAMNAAAIGQSTSAFTNLPYAAATLGVAYGSVTGRVVGCGIEVISTTATLYEQGLVQTFVDPTDSSIAAYATANFSARKECLTHPLKKGEVYHLSVTPSTTAMTQYGTTSLAYNNNAASVIGGMLFSGASPTNPVTLMCRATLIVEYIGSPTEDTSVAKPVPPAGAMDHIVSLCQKAHTHHQQNPHLKPAALLSLAKKAYSFINSPAGKSGLTSGMALLSL